MKSNEMKPNEIPVVFRNGSNYDYHFIMKELAKEFEGQFECPGENTEEYKTFSVPIEKEVTKTDKYGHGIFVTISYKSKFTDSTRFRAFLWSDLADNLIEGIHKINCKDLDCVLEYESVKNNFDKI